MSLETPNRIHALGIFIPVVAAPFTSQVLASKGVGGFTRTGAGQYLVTLQRQLAFSEGYAVAGVPPNFQGVPGAQLSDDGTQALISVLDLGTGLPIDPPFVTFNAWTVREGEGEGPAIPFPVVPPPLPTGSATKDIFSQAETNATYGGNNTPVGFRVRRIGATGSFNFNFRVPHDFSAITSLILTGAPDADFGPDGIIDLASSYGANAQGVGNHSETGSLSSLSGSTDVRQEFDLSSVFTSLAANDYCGVEIDHVSGIATTINYWGIRLRYS